MTLARFIVALAIGGMSWTQAGGPIQPGTSPRIEQLTKQIATGGPSIVTAFWATLAREHAPIVEPAPGDPAHVLVTFVWRGTPDTRSVQVFGTEMSLIPRAISGTPRSRSSATIESHISSSRSLARGRPATSPPCPIR
jgi:hypothetical protein